MLAFDPTFDYFALLGLEPAAALGLPIARLRERVAEQKRSWSGKEQNPKYQQEARAAKERLLQFEQLLRDTDALAAYARFQTERRAARRAGQESEVARLVTTALAGKKAISPRQRTLLDREARDRKIPEDVIEAALRRLGVAVSDSVPADKPVVPRLADALDPAVMTEIHNWLAVLGKPNLYALLDLPESAPSAALVTMAKALYGRWSKMLPKTSECTAWEKTTLACLTYLRDVAGKGRYNRALFNLRIDQFIRHVDLVLAGVSVGRAEQELLTRVGVVEFGLSEKTVEECVRARAAGVGVALSNPVSVTVSFDGQARCRFCFTWNPAIGCASCRNCDRPLREVCANPTCRAPATGDAVACPRCRLPYVKGKLYASVMALADASLDAGMVEQGVRACAVAEQMLPGPEIATRLARARQIDALLATVTQAASQKHWSKVLCELPRLLEHAPRLRKPGIPRLEAVSDYTRAARAKLDGLPEGADPLKVAKMVRACLTQWADCEVAQRRLRLAADALLTSGRLAAVRHLAEKILVAHAGDPILLSWVTELQQRANGLVSAGSPDLATKDVRPPGPGSGNGSVVPWWSEHLKHTGMAKA
jgi:hypothetical protein